MNHKPRIKISQRNIRYADDTTPMAENKEQLKSFLMRVKEGSEKAGLNSTLGIRSHHLMANRWGKSGSSDRVYFLGLQKSLQMVTVAIKLKDTCSLEGKL